MDGGEDGSGQPLFAHQVKIALYDHISLACLEWVWLMVNFINCLTCSPSKEHFIWSHSPYLIGSEYEQ